MKVGDELKCHLWVFLTDRKRIMGRASRNLRVLLKWSLQGTVRVHGRARSAACLAVAVIAAKRSRRTCCDV